MDLIFKSHRFHRIARRLLSTNKNAQWTRNYLLNKYVDARMMFERYPYLFERITSTGVISPVNISKFHKYLRLLVDMTGDPALWPRNITRTRRLLFSPHLKRAGRLHIVTFLLRNGVSPHVIKSYLITGGFLNDMSALRGVHSIINNWLCGDKLVVNHDITSNDFDLFERKYVARSRNCHHPHYKVWVLENQRNF